MRLTIRLKLGLTFAAIIALSALTAILGISKLGLLDRSMRDLVAGPVANLQVSEELFINLLQVVRWEKNLILSSTPDDIAFYDKNIQQSRLDFTASSIRERVSPASRASRNGQQSTIPGRNISLPTTSFGTSPSAARPRRRRKYPPLTRAGFSVKYRRRSSTSSGSREAPWLKPLRPPPPSMRTRAFC
jgi:hypothetical protein